MAVGGMVGGGIFSVLGVVINLAGSWAWLSFLFAGLVALISAHSYSQLSIKYKESGGAFTFLREINHKGFAGSLSWVLILGYTLTISVYAYTFGEYVAYVFNTGAWLPRVLLFTVIAVLTLINLRGVGETSKFEILAVYGKLFILLGLAVFGLAKWNPEQLTNGVASKPWSASIIGYDRWASDGFKLVNGDQVAVYGRIDQDFLEKKKVEAGTVYVKNIDTYFFANSDDEEDFTNIPNIYSYVTTLPEGVLIDLQGKITKISGSEFTVDTGLRRVNVDTKKMTYNPLDKIGFTRLSIGDRVRVSGRVEDNIFESKEVSANYLTKLSSKL